MVLLYLYLVIPFNEWRAQEHRQALAQRRHELERCQCAATSTIVHAGIYWNGCGIFFFTFWLCFITHSLFIPSPGRAPFKVFQTVKNFKWRQILWRVKLNYAVLCALICKYWAKIFWSRFFYAIHRHTYLFYKWIYIDIFILIKKKCAQTILLSLCISTKQTIKQIMVWNYKTWFYFIVTIYMVLFYLFNLKSIM